MQVANRGIWAAAPPAQLPTSVYALQDEVGSW